MSRRVLVIEDNRDLAELVSLHLGDLGCEVRLAADGMTGFRQAQASHFDAIILDLMLPGMEGLELCQRLRAQKRYVPILMLTAKSTEVDRVVGLEIGADDYITKPFSMPELMARVKAVFRRIEGLAKPEGESSKEITAGDLVIDVGKHAVTISGEPVDLTAKEFALLAHFAMNPGQVYTRSQLLDLVWGYSHAGYEHTVNSHINRLRSKIERKPTRPRYVLTVWGVGYKFNDQFKRSLLPGPA
ncbi:MAG: response regulator transcription factor [Gammaproteobacteria bacterium]|nr:response regulator transcription factor [Gammaproteobacteria bacterium]